MTLNDIDPSRLIVGYCYQQNIGLECPLWQQKTAPL